MMKRRQVRILYVIDELDVGGTEQQVLELLQELNRLRYEPLVVCFRDRGRVAQEIEALGISVFQIPKRWAIDPVFFIRLLRFLWKWRPTIVQTFLFTANTWGRLAARLCCVPVVISSERNVDVWKRKWHIWTDRLLAYLSSCIIVNAECIQRFLREQEGIRHAEIRVIYNGVRWQRFSSIHSDRRNQSFRLVGMIGRLEPQKDYTTGLLAFGRLLAKRDDVRLRIVGDGSLRRRLQQEVEQLGLSHAVEFVGTHRNIPQLLSEMDLLVVSSTREGCANVILEAMAAGVPVVATAVGGNPELIEADRTGLLVPPRNSEMLAEAVSRLLDDPVLWRDFSSRGQRRACTQFSVETMADAYDRLYQELLKPKIRLCYLIDDLGFGGAQQQLVELIKKVSLRRYVVRVVALSDRKVDYGQSLSHVGISPLLISHSGTWSWSTFFRLIRFFRAWRPDVVQTCLFTADLYGRLAARVARVPVVISSIRSVDLDKPRHYVWVDRCLKRITDAFVVNAQAVREMLVQREGVPAARIRTIYNGVDVGAFAPGKGTGDRGQGVGDEGKGQDRGQGEGDKGKGKGRGKGKNSTPLVGIVGRLAPVKDHETFIRAAAQVARRYPQPRFVIVGSGPEEAQLKRLAQVEGLNGRLRFMEAQPDVIELFDALDVVVVSSLYEGCSNVILEGMAMGKPVVATTVGGNPELVEEGKTGFLVPTKDPGQLAQAIEKIIQNPAKARQMGIQGRLRVEKQFGLDRMVNETCGLYEELLEEKRAYVRT